MAACFRRAAVAGVLTARQLGSSTLCEQSSLGVNCAPLGFQTRCFGAGDLKAVAARMKSVKSIQKITKAMKMVAASKLRQDQRRLENGLPFAQASQSVLSRIEIPSQEGDVAILAFTSDKGLCGGVNSFVARKVRDEIRAIEASGSRCAVFGIGDKLRSALQRLFGDRFHRLFTELSKTPCSFVNACAVAERILEARPSSLRVVYSHFKSAVAFETISQPLLSPRLQSNFASGSELCGFEVEPELSETWPDLYEFNLGCSVYGFLLDSVAAEQSARMSAMDSASTNAGEMLSALTLKYNRARQSKITTELVEIISGANALE